MEVAHTVPNYHKVNPTTLIVLEVHQSYSFQGKRIAKALAFCVIIRLICAIYLEKNHLQLFKLWLVKTPALPLKSVHTSTELAEDCNFTQCRLKKLKINLKTIQFRHSIPRENKRVLGSTRVQQGVYSLFHFKLNLETKTQNFFIQTTGVYGVKRKQRVSQHMIREAILLNNTGVTKHVHFNYHGLTLMQCRVHRSLQSVWSL